MEGFPYNNESYKHDNNQSADSKLLKGNNNIAEKNSIEERTRNVGIIYLCMYVPQFKKNFIAHELSREKRRRGLKWILFEKIAERKKRIAF